MVELTGRFRCPSVKEFHAASFTSENIFWQQGKRSGGSLRHGDAGYFRGCCNPFTDDFVVVAVVLLSFVFMSL